MRHCPSRRPTTPRCSRLPTIRRTLRSRQLALQTFHDDANPFTLPPDDHIFQQRQEERRAQKEAREVALKASVQEKSTFAFRMQSTFCSTSSVLKEHSGASKGPSRMQPGQVLAPALAGERRGRGREPLAQMLAKKREIFLVQMALDTKRAEIRRLEERVLQRQEALRQSEAMLEADAKAFDAFIKENDDKVKEAEKRAEIEKARKQEKVNDIKRLTQAIAQIRSELSRHEEAVKECGRYRGFLDAITPGQWFEEQRQQRAAARQQVVDAWEAECQAIRKQKADAQAAKSAAEAAYHVAKTQQEAEKADRLIRETTEAFKEMLKISEPPRPDLRKLFPTDPDLAPPGEKGEGGQGPAPPSSEGAEAMYFKEPGQLLGLFKEMEAQALVLIQNAQESEESLEEARQKLSDTQARMDAEVAGLQAQVAQLEASLRGVGAKEAALREVVAASSGQLPGLGAAGGVSLAELTKKVQEVYVLAGFELDPSIAEAPVQMVAHLEARLEEHLAAVAALPPEVVEQAEKAREKERRQAAREQKQAVQRKEHEARLKRALERAAAPVYKKLGKPVMWRSMPSRDRVVVQEEEGGLAEAELDLYLTRDLLA